LCATIILYGQENNNLTIFGKTLGVFPAGTVSMSLMITLHEAKTQGARVIFTGPNELGYKTNKFAEPIANRSPIPLELFPQTQSIFMSLFWGWYS